MTSPLLAALRARIRRTVDYELLARYRQATIRTGVVLYEAFAGAGLLCNPEAIFRELLAADDLAQLRHVWVLDRRQRRNGIPAEFSRDPRVRFVTKGSPAYLKAVSTSEYLVNNATFPHWFSKRPGQVYLNTWHGTPLKRMGYDMPDGAREAGNTVRNFVAADYLLSQNAFMTERMYARAYKLAGHFLGTVIEEGYPRVDRQELDSAARSQVLGALSTAGLRVGHRRIVLYAPTWRGERFADPSDDIDNLLDHVTELQHRLGDEVVVLLKTHQILERFVTTRPDLRAVLVPGALPTNRVLGVTDTLITDYSSIFFDFLSTGRRIVFFAPDADAYGTSRGLYFTEGELPGPVCSTVEVVAEMVGAESSDPKIRSRIRDEWQSRFAPLAAGSAARVVDVVFRGRTEGMRLHDLSASSRTSLLIHVGSLASNGITSAALNLLTSLPADRYDVSVAYTRSTSQQQIDNSIAIPDTVRQFPREGGMNGAKGQHLRRRVFFWLKATDAHRTDGRQRRMWDDEWVRCFGPARFDHVVDFSGYSQWLVTLLLHSPKAHRSIWLHNDMAAEVQRRIGRRRPLAGRLSAIFAMYPEYDSRVAVSPALAAINEVGLAEVGLPHGAIGSALNLLNAPRVRRMADATPYDGEEAAVDGFRPDWVTALERADDSVWFITVGRYTREKNQSRLLVAFSAVHAIDRRARLLLVGHGPLEAELSTMVDDLGLKGLAFLTGALRNPFAVMRLADCFVLSSDYEGQPMVLLEAAILGMPIVSTDFGSIRDALPDGMIHVVTPDVDGLVSGMMAHLAGRVAHASLDTDAYNLGALRQFEDAIGARTSPSRTEVVR